MVVRKVAEGYEAEVVRAVSMVATVAAGYRGCQREPVGVSLVEEAMAGVEGVVAAPAAVVVAWAGGAGGVAAAAAVTRAVSMVEAACEVWGIRG